MNKQVILKKRPIGMPAPETWEQISNEIPEPKEGEVVIQTHYISLDPAMRGWINDMKSYLPPVGIGEVMRAGTVGTVVKANNHPAFEVGDCIVGWGGVQQYILTGGENHYKVDANLVPMEKYLGALGMPGMTAYFGITEVAEVREDDVVLISGAAGAVGSVAGQIAKIKGAKVIGIAGGPDKCKHVVEDLGFDACIDYKNENIYARIKECCPKGVNVYFDNVGGEILDAALANIALNARIVLCGAISQYNQTEVTGPKNYLSLLINRGTMQGMIVLDYADKYQAAGLQMGMWMMQGKLKSEEDVYEGIENFYSTFTRLFTGEKRGKLVLKILEEVPTS